LIHKELGFILLGRELDLRWRVPSFNGCLILRIRRANSIDVEALMGRVVGVIDRVGVRSAEVVV
jgi:hypothetical protein